MLKAPSIKYVKKNLLKLFIKINIGASLNYLLIKILLKYYYYY